MLYQDKSLEELMDIVGLYKQAHQDIFGEFNDEEFIGKVEDLIERLKQRRFESVFQSMNPATLKLIPRLLREQICTFELSNQDEPKEKPKLIKARKR